MRNIVYVWKCRSDKNVPLSRLWQYLLGLLSRKSGSHDCVLASNNWGIGSNCWYLLQDEGEFCLETIVVYFFREMFE